MVSIDAIGGGQPGHRDGARVTRNQTERAVSAVAGSQAAATAASIGPAAGAPGNTSAVAAPSQPSAESARTNAQAPPRLWTIGHSTLPWQAFVQRLHEAGITALVDVRRHAGSRRNPQFSSEAMARDLPHEGIAYLPVPELGGRRTPHPDSRNVAWRNPSFRGYADYMASPEYRAAADALAHVAMAQPCAVMCAEAMWWQCHRSLIADDFKSRGWEVLHLLAPGRVEPHPYTSAARIVDGRLDYTAVDDDNYRDNPQPSLF